MMETIISNPNATAPQHPLANGSGTIDGVERFLAELPGIAAPLKRALDEDDFAIVGVHAWRLRCMAAAYGFPAIADAALQVEMTDRRNVAGLAKAVQVLVNLCSRPRAIL